MQIDDRFQSIKLNDRATPQPRILIRLIPGTRCVKGWGFTILGVYVQDTCTNMVGCLSPIIQDSRVLTVIWASSGGGERLHAGLRAAQPPRVLLGPGVPRVGAHAPYTSHSRSSTLGCAVTIVFPAGVVAAGAVRARDQGFG